VCLENKVLMRLNCNHYICLEDIQTIIGNVNPVLRRCPICRVSITNYGCNGNIINLPVPLPIQNPDYDVEGETDEEGYETDELYGGKYKKKYTRRKINKKRKTYKRKTYKRKTYKRKTNKRKTYKIH